MSKIKNNLVRKTKSISLVFALLIASCTVDQISPQQKVTTVKLTKTQSTDFPINTITPQEENLPLIGFTASSVSLRENDKAVEISINLDFAPSVITSILYSVSDGTAKAWDDYLSNDGKIVFLPGETQKKITVEVIDDYLSEPAEFFYINLSAPINAKLGGETAFQVIIKDNDHTWSANNSLNIASEGVSLQLYSNVDNRSLIGYSVSMNGDANGDGFSDILIGGYKYDGYSNAEGAVFLLFGGKHFERADVLDLNQEAIIIQGARERSWFGHSVSIGGDIDGDGISDLAIGARFDPTEDETNRAGAAFVIMSGDIPDKMGHYVISNLPHVQLSRQIARGEVGFEVSLGGDIDGDNLADLVVRSIIDVENKITGVYLVPGSVLRKNVGNFIDLDNTPGIILFYSNDPYSDAGRTIAFLEDFDGDGLPEIALGSLDGTAYYAPDQVQPRRSFLWVIKSTTINLSQQPMISLDSDPGIIRFSINSDQRFHVSVGSAGDIDQDGLGDLLVGLTNTKTESDLRGSALLILGKSLSSYNGEIPLNDAFDLMIKSFEQGESLVGDLFGWSVTEHAGDVSADGIPDLLIGARGSSINGANSGAAFLIPGELVQHYLRNGEGFLYIENEPSVIILFGESNGDLLSSKRRISNAGDVDGDGYSDLLIGAPGKVIDGKVVGTAYLVYGNQLFK